MKQNDIDQDIVAKDLEHCLKSMRSLSVNDVRQNSKYLRELLRLWFNRYYSSGNQTLADNLRRTICWIDEALFKEDINSYLESR